MKRISLIIHNNPKTGLQTPAFGIVGLKRSAPHTTPVH